MPKFILLILIACIGCTAEAQKKQPKLVVGIVVDQMRNDYLQRYAPNFGENGFKRLIREGFNAQNTHYNYIPTYTGPGHASIYTGTTPKYHGIISNDWYSKVLKRNMYCVGDSTANGLGGSKMNGNKSPRNLLATTITDELKTSNNFQSKVFSVSIKDRGAVLPAGHVADGAFWYDYKTGEFMSSDFYFDELPSWAKRFNEQKLVDKYSNQVWETLLPMKSYERSFPDDSPYESGFKGKDTPTLPYDLAELRTKNEPYGLIRSTPFGNNLVLDFAKENIKAEELGKGSVTDFMAVSLSSTDYVGHNFGPNSVELEDTYVRLDRDLEDFLDFLDKTVGEGNYLLFLTSDHGVVANPQYLIDNNLPGGFSDNMEVKKFIKKSLKEILGEGDFLESFSNGQLFFNESAIQGIGRDVEVTERYLADRLLELPEVAETYIGSDMTSREFDNPTASLIKNGYNNQLSGNVMLVLKPGYLPMYGNSKKGTSHGSGYNYDTHVPLLFFGTNVPKGSTNRKTYITDIAPTLSGLLEITLPNAAVLGEPIQEIFE
ncbi:MAG: alkaline phosphatase family protein [Cyclobacteriaceae bacterium]